MQLPTSAALLVALLGTFASALPQPQDADPSSAVNTASPATTAPVDNPFTIYTSMTNSLGVITGIPALPSLPDAITDIPALPTLITSQPILASIPAGLTSGLNTVTLANTTAIVSVGEGVTSVVVSSTTSHASSESVKPPGSGSGSDTGADGSSSSTGLAAMPTAAVGYAAAGLGLVAAILV